MTYIKTIWENDVTPLNADNMNKIEEGIYALSHGLPDTIIDTQEKFDELIESPTWLGFENIALSGSFTATGKITIPSTVKKIEGVNGTVITINSEGLTQIEDFAFGYATKPTGKEYEIRNLKILCDSNSRVGGSSAFQSCIKNCINIHNVTVWQFGDPLELATDETHCFDNCDNVDNCYAGVLTESGIGFYNCSNISNCSGSSAAITYNLFNDCKNIVNCDILINGDHASPSVFTNCSYLVNCHVTFDSITSTGTVTGFNFCKSMGNCSCVISTSESSIFGAYGFLCCDKLSSCVSTVSDMEAENIYRSLYCTCVGVSCDIADQKE
ncbi:MAG: hypothetical protein J6S67_19970 [Methanobrevibacter sp.]|nr:hypothetical protein [Methanobrevibacter sp.]